MGHGWTDSFASSLSAARPVPGDIYTIDGLATGNGDGGAPGSSVLEAPGGVWSDASGVYIADTAGNRIQEIPATSGTQWGIAMTAGDVYTIAGSPTGVAGDSPSGTAAASALLDAPASVITALGNLYIADTANSRVLEIPATSGSQRGVSMTAGDMYVIAGQANGAAGTAGDGGSATSAFLDAPAGLAPGHLTSDIYIADTGNNRVQEIPAATGTRWGQAMTANDIYTVAGSAAGTSGTSGDGGKATSGRLDRPRGVQTSGGHDLYIADTGNNRIQELAAAAGAQWNQAMTADDVYTVAGSPTGVPGRSGDGGAAASALLSMPTNVRADNGQQLYITDFGNNRIQEVARTSHTEFGTAMTVNDKYTIWLVAPARIALQLSMPYASPHRPKLMG